MQTELCQKQQVDRDIIPSAFLKFMKDKQDFVCQLNPNMTALDVVAFLHAKWEVMDGESKAAYEEK
jgi:hypothetical protein